MFQCSTSALAVDEGEGRHFPLESVSGGGESSQLVVNYARVEISGIEERLSDSVCVCVCTSINYEQVG